MLMQRVEPPRRSASGHRHVRSMAALMAVRCLTALFGGYALTSGVATLVARLLPLSRVEATVWAMLPAFFIYAVVALWSFHEPRALRVASAVWGGALVIGALVWMIGVRP